MTQENFDSEVYILSWDMNGLESCINASQVDREKTWNLLADKDERHEDVGTIIRHLTLRARFNSQRHYEIYAINVDPSITKEDLVEQFDQNPQAMADLVRARGRKLYSDRVDSDRVVIR